MGSDERLRPRAETGGTQMNPMAEAAKAVFEGIGGLPDPISHMEEHYPDKQIVLSPRLEYLARRVGGCQTEELLALLRRVLYEGMRVR